jgi:hypothetical protein
MCLHFIVYFTNFLIMKGIKGGLWHYLAVCIFVCFSPAVLEYIYIYLYRLCCLVVRVLGYRSRGPGSIPGSTRFFLEVVSLELGQLSLVSAIEKLPERNSSDSGIENQEHGRRDPSRWPRGNLYPQKLTLTLPTSGGRSVGIVRSRTQATELFIYIYIWNIYFICVSTVSTVIP